MKTIFKRNGNYVGFVHKDFVFSGKGRYLGWIDFQQNAWNADGSYLGQVTEEYYIMKNLTQAEPVNRVARVPPVSPTVPMHPGNKPACSAKPGWIDSLNSIDRMPNVEDLLGVWNANDEELSFKVNREFTLSQYGEGHKVYGQWGLAGGFLTTELFIDSSDEKATNLNSNQNETKNVLETIYNIIEYKHNSQITLREYNLECATLPIILKRICAEV